jgi:sialic acid synthase SpsE
MRIKKDKGRVDGSPWKGEVGPLLIAEIGGNHEGDFRVAKNMVQQAITSGVDCIKLQLYTADTLVSKVESPDRHAHFKTFELTKGQHIYLAKMCQDANITYLASVWSLEMLEWIDPYLDFYKIGSGDMTAWALLREFALRDKPILLSTGLSSMDEVLDTVDYVQSINAHYKDPDMLCILQCTSMYPINDSDANLLVMDSIKSRTNLSVGYSDHTIGSMALTTAAAMGASVLEFHFTDSREGKIFRDHQVSLTVDEVLALKANILQIRVLKGSEIKSPQLIELENRHEISFRRGVYPKRSIYKDEIIKREDLILLRPAHGTDAREIDLVIGSKALKDLEVHVAIEHNIDYL